jgi:hypothetical protein
VAFIARLLSALAVALLALLPAFAAAQSYARLHVRAFSLSADRYEVKVGETFHLRITAHLDERVSQLSDVTLPDLSGFDSLGDERNCFPAGKGSTCIETMSLVPLEPGDKTIAPVTLDAIDASTGRLVRFATNPITIRVVGDPYAGIGNWLPAAADALSGVVRMLIVFGLVALALLAIRWAFGRKAPPAAVRAPAPAAAPVAAAPPPAADFGALIARLSAEPTRVNVVAVRDALRARVGARERETLSDLIARRAVGNDPALLGALFAIERAAFCEDDRLPEAVRDALPHLTA